MGAAPLRRVGSGPVEMSSGLSGGAHRVSASRAVQGRFWEQQIVPPLFLLAVFSWENVFSNLSLSFPIGLVLYTPQNNCKD